MALAPTKSSGGSAHVPRSEEVERDLLGGLLLDNSRIPTIIDLLPPQVRNSLRRRGDGKANRRYDDVEPLFYNRANQEIFEALVELFERDQGIDLATLGNELERRGRFEAVGGVDYLASLAESVMYTGLLPEYMRILVEKWRCRSLLRTAEAITEDVLSGGDDVEHMLDMAEKRIFDLAQNTEEGGFVHIADVAADVMSEIEAKAKHDTQGLNGLPTGFKRLDELTTGLRPSNLIILAARPSVGKSAFAMNIATEAAVRHGKPVGIFSLEMSRQELNQRLLCTLSGVSAERMRSNRLSREDLDKLHHETMRLNNTPLYIDDSANLSILELRTRARRLKDTAPNLSLLIVDYLQLMTAGISRVENRQQEVSMISRALKALARDLDIPVLALSQLSRQSEQRAKRGASLEDKLPKLSDLRESGAIEQDADVVIFIHREILKKDAQPDEPAGADLVDMADVVVGKQRNGPTGRFKLIFRKDITRFGDVHYDALGRNA